MKFTIEGRQTVLDVIDAGDRIEALKKFHAKYSAVNEIVDIREGNKPRKRTPEEIEHQKENIRRWERLSK